MIGLTPIKPSLTAPCEAGLETDHPSPMKHLRNLDEAIENMLAIPLKESFELRPMSPGRPKLAIAWCNAGAPPSGVEVAQQRTR